jgi:hypothetical protein
MEYSPYAPPQLGRGVGYSEHGDFRPVGWTTTAATIAIFSSVALGMVVNGFSIAYPHPSPDRLVIVAAMAILGLLLQVASLAAYVFFLMWMHRSSKNAHSFGHEGLEFTPGWCVGWWFIPVAFWWMPYRALREIWRASDPETVLAESRYAWAGQNVPSTFLLWWLVWQLSAIPAIGGVVTSTMTTLNYAELTWLTAVFMGVTQLLTIAAAAMIVSIMRQLDRRQQFCWQKIASSAAG